MCYWSRVQHIHILLNKVRLHAQKCHRYEKNVITIVLLRALPNISLSPLWTTNHAYAFQQQDGFYFTRQFYIFAFGSIFIKYLNYIKYLQYEKIQAHGIKLYLTTCFQILSRIILSIFFGYVIGLYFVCLYMWKFTTYFEDRKVLESTLSWLLIESNRPHPEHYYRTNT